VLKNEGARIEVELRANDDATIASYLGFATSREAWNEKKSGELFPMSPVAPRS